MALLLLLHPLLLVVPTLSLSSPETNANTMGFCSWDACYSSSSNSSASEGGDFCNTDRHHCETECGARWCEAVLPANNMTHYCSWVGCNGQRQGGEQCNHNQDSCFGCGAGAEWCAFDDNNTTFHNAFYCNWLECNGERMGGDYCNESMERCLGACGSGAQWCPNNTTTIASTTTTAPGMADGLVNPTLPSSIVLNATGQGDGSAPTTNPQTSTTANNATTSLFGAGFCSWNECYSGTPDEISAAQGGDFCNTNQSMCEGACGAKWCETLLVANNVTHYCSWVGCNGQRQGGDHCNHNEASCLGCGEEALWCAFADDTNALDDFYCNWLDCNGVRMGGDYCNESQERCESSCGAGATWCPNSTMATASMPSTAEGPTGGVDVHVPETPPTETATAAIVSGNGDTVPASGTGTTTTAGEEATPYCSFTECFGAPQGGTYCNESPEQCLSCGNDAMWCEAPPPPPNGYCSWSLPQCSGRVEGGEFCNASVERCLSCGTGAVWCQHTTTTTTTDHPEAGLTHSSHLAGTIQKRSDVEEDGPLASSGNSCEITVGFVVAALMCLGF